MRRAIIGKTWLRDLWQSSVWLVAGLIFLALIALHLVNGYIVDPLIYASMTGDSGWVSKAVWRLQTWGSVALFVAVGARLVWGVPALAVGRAKSLKVAFLKMRGNYRLALLVCLLTVMPLYIFNYHFGIWPNTGMSLGALLFESELQAWLWFLKDGAAIACRSILLSALAAVIYRAEFGSRGATAP